MSKKRTKKDKSSARHPFLISWKEGTNQASPRSVVKRQTINSNASVEKRNAIKNNAHLLDNNTDLTSIKKGMAKSLILTGLILAVEVVLYFWWS